MENNYENLIVHLFLYLNSMLNYLKRAHGVIIPLLALLLMGATCVQQSSKNIRQIGVYNLTIPEPSGLALSEDKSHLYIVSDHKGIIYETTLQGVVTREIKIKNSDYEGVAWSASNALFYLVDESKNKIKIYDIHGNKVTDHVLSAKASTKSGPEGIAIDASTDHIYVVNEKSPRLLYQLDSTFNEIRKQKIDFLSDISGIEVNPMDGAIWLMSDEDQRVVRLGKDGKPEATYLMDVEQMEGIAIDWDNKLMYVVSDKEEELHIYKYQ